MKYSNSFLTALLLLTAVMLVSCRGQLSDRPPILPQQNMWSQDRFDSQEENPFFEDGRAMRMPVEGTVARGQLREDIPFYEGIDENGDAVDEIPMTVTREFLYRGQDRYDIYCTVCHGGTGDGQSVIADGQFGFPPMPSFHGDRVLNLNDGEIYSAIYRGFGTMLSYASLIDAEDRWAIVAYVRALQESQRIPEDVIREYDVDIAALEEAHLEILEREEALAAAAEPVEEEVSVERGEQLFTRFGCQACHSTDGAPMIGPTIAGLYESEREFEDGTSAVADEEYLIESIVDPGLRVTAGYPNVMQPFDYLADDEVLSLVEFIRSLSDEN